MKLGKKLNYLLLVLILLLGAFLRIRNLTSNPAGFFCDEASIGVNAYKIWESGRDNHGKLYPLLFEAFGEYKNPVFIYSLVPVVGVFGLFEAAVRSLSVIYGLLTILIGFLVFKEIFNAKVALVFSFLLSISPWHIHFSRIGFGLISSLFWLLLCLFLLWKSRENFKFYYGFLFTLFLTFFSYNPPKLYLPFLIISFVGIYWKDFKNNLLFKPRFWLSSLIFICLTLLITLPYLRTGKFFSRWNQVKSEKLTTVNIKKAYFNHFSLIFLFKKGDIGFPGQFITRHSIRGMGELYWFQLPLILFGLLSVFFSKQKRREKIVFGIVPLLLYPTGSMFTGLAPQATRSIMGVIPLNLLSAIGILWLISLVNKISKKLVYISTIDFVVIVFLSFLKFNSLFLKYPLYSSDYWGWQYGPRPIMNYFLNHKDDYDQLIIEGRFNGAYIFIPFYNPKNFCQGKCRLGGIEEADSSKKQLFAISKETYDQKVEKFCKDFVIDKKIRYPNEEVAFLIGRCLN